MQSKPYSISSIPRKTGAMRFQTLEEWLAWQESLHFTAIELGLDRCLSVADKLGLLQPNYTVVSVAGTNGKGSSVTMLESILRNAGYKTACYTSPHLVRYNERIQLKGQEVTDKVLCEAFGRIDQARGDISLTYFEFGTLAALDIFQRSGIDIVILEVGLGGRLDAVNCLDADIALVTSIDIDHENWLGSDRESIAREKAGIFRTSSPAICSDPQPPESLLRYADSLDTPLYLQGRDYKYQITRDTWLWQTDSIAYANLPKPSLYNDSQVQNAAGVLMVLTALADQFPVGINAIRKGLREFKLNGRFQIVPDKAQIVLDVAHNRQAAKILVQNLRQFPTCGKTHILIGMLKDKDRLAIFNELIGIADHWHVVALDDLRGADSKLLASELTEIEIDTQVACYDSVAEALDYVRRIVEPQDRIVITGSFISVGAAINHLKLQH